MEGVVTGKNTKTNLTLTPGSHLQLAVIGREVLVGVNLLKMKMVKTMK
jgi:hypothetical protein